MSYFDAGAFADYLKRITSKKSSLNGFVDALAISIRIISKKDFSEAEDFLGYIIDFFDAADYKLFSKISKVDGISSFALNILKDYFNPYLYDHQVAYNLAVYLIEQMGSYGAMKFVAEAIVAGSATFGPFGGIVTGTMALFATTYLLKYFKNTTVFT